MSNADMPDEMREAVESLIDTLFSRRVLITAAVIAALAGVAAVIALWLLFFGIGQ